MLPQISPDLQPVPMLDFAREYSLIRDEVLAALTAVCDSQRFILGPEVSRFEQDAARACNVPFAIGCSSGTEALWLALAATGVGQTAAAAVPGDPSTVITTAFSFFATVSSILRAGARPLLADIDPRTFNLSPESTEEALQKARRPAVAIMPVHLYGQCADMTAFAALAAKYDLKLIEDSAQAFGAGWSSLTPTPEGRDPSAHSANSSTQHLGAPAETVTSAVTRAGDLGDAAAFSFYPTKNLSAFGDAGLVTTRDPETAERAAMLRVHGMRRRYFHDEVGWNARMDTLQAAVLEVKLRRLESGNHRRRELAALYDRMFRGAGLAAPTGSVDIADGVVLPYTDPRATPVFHQYVIRVPRRDELRTFLASHGIGSEIYYPQPLHLQASLAALGYKRGDFPVSERAAIEVLALPIFPELRDDEAQTVVEAIRRFYA